LNLGKTTKMAAQMQNENPKALAKFMSTELRKFTKGRACVRFVAGCA